MAVTKVCVAKAMLLAAEVPLVDFNTLSRRKRPKMAFLSAQATTSCKTSKTFNIHQSDPSKYEVTLRILMDFAVG